jgi:hypothetical protein
MLREDRGRIWEEEGIIRVGGARGAKGKGRCESGGGQGGVN